MMPLRPTLQGEVGGQAAIREHRRPVGDVFEADDRYRALLGDEAWRSLPVAIRRRFSKKIDGALAVQYVGEVTAMRFNLWGCILTRCLRVIGAPLPYRNAVGTASVVSVTEDAATGGQVWSRLYANRAGFPQIIHSAKRFRGPTGLEEYIGCGISIALRPSVERRSLVFRSVAFIIELRGFRLQLPAVLEPGELTVVHRETDCSKFMFSMTLRHRQFGELVHQEGLYREEAP